MSSVISGDFSRLTIVFGERNRFVPNRELIANFNSSGTGSTNQVIPMAPVRFSVIFTLRSV